MKLKLQSSIISSLLRYFSAVAICLVLFTGVSAQANSKTNTKKTVGKVLYGQASFYANKFNGRKTASGELFNQNKFRLLCMTV